MEDLFVSLQQNLGHQGVNFEYEILESHWPTEDDVKLLTYLFIFFNYCIFLLS